MPNPINPSMTLAIRPATMERLRAFSAMTGFSFDRIVDAALRIYFGRPEMQDVERVLSVALGLEEGDPTANSARGLGAPTATRTPAPVSRCACGEPGKPGTKHGRTSCVASPTTLDTGESATKARRSAAARKRWESYTPEERLARVNRVREGQGLPPRTSLDEVEHEPTTEKGRKLASAVKASWAKYTPEQRAARVAKMLAARGLTRKPWNDPTRAAPGTGS